MRRIYVVTGYHYGRRVLIFLAVLLGSGFACVYLAPTFINVLQSLPVATALLSWEMPWLQAGEGPAWAVDMQGLLGSQMAVVEALGRNGPAVAARHVTPQPGEESGPRKAVPATTESGLQAGPGPEPVGKAEAEAELPDPAAPLVFIYNTHNAETFIPTDGVAKKEGTNSGVTSVAKRLYDTLTGEYHIPAVRADTVHDYPDFSRSYVNSARTVEEYLQRYPSLQVLVDVHRDAGLGPLTATWQGEKVAQILFVVGSDTKLDHPRWEENLAFARRVEAKLEELYPGVSRGVRVQDGRYNQHLHPHAILVEIGTAENSLEEALRGAELLARVLADIME